MKWEDSHIQCKMPILSTTKENKKQTFSCVNEMRKGGGA